MFCLKVNLGQGWPTPKNWEEGKAKEEEEEEEVMFCFAVFNYF